eukprot:TRINITY_DN11935_c0_g1_i1.p1 TRINITY_DN11935_c0_g1~~TRINITY_DN11935_c0_g1_i1.p1  ORF type:complete len:118 (-),score=27.64 TRINITY_DN11935_c0_g1_i1:179-532(-)
MDINNTMHLNGVKLDTLLLGIADLKDGQCVQDNRSRLFTAFAGSLDNNSPAICIAKCAVLAKDDPIATPGFAFAGVQYGTECFCGQCTLPKKVYLPAESCNMPCRGNANLTCGEVIQ